jgi:hypothetical protein
MAETLSSSAWPLRERARARTVEFHCSSSAVGLSAIGDKTSLSAIEDILFLSFMEDKMRLSPMEDKRGASLWPRRQRF